MGAPEWNTADLVAQLLERRARRPAGEAEQCAAIGLDPVTAPEYWMTQFLPLPMDPACGSIADQMSGLFFDGLELASLLTGKPPGGTTPVNPTAHDPFWRTATLQAPKLLTGPLAEVVTRFIDAAGPRHALDCRDAILESGSIMMTMGILLHHSIHGELHPAFADLMPARRAPIERDVQPRPRMMWQAEEAEPFIDQILASPDDNSLRLVFADWLQEHHDPFGELISVQCEYTAARGARRVALADRADALLARYGSAWDEAVMKSGLHASELGPHGRFLHVYVRGFVHEIEGQIGTLLHHYAALSRYPLRSVRLVGITAAMIDVIANTPAHPTVDSFHLAANKFGTCHEVLATPFFDRARSLDVGWNEMDHEAITSLARLRSTRLRELHIGHAWLDSDSVFELCAAPCLQTVEYLDLSWNDALDDSVLAVLAHLPRLRLVNLDRTNVSDDGLARHPGLHVYRPRRAIPARQP